jgi:type IV pilus assembly protein PilC
LHMIERQTQSRSMKKVLSVVITDVENGQFLSTSLKRYENILGGLFINIIRIGEASGTLAENLGFLADELKKKQDLHSKIISALIYPVIILLTTIGLILIVMFEVFPKILPVFKSFNVKLPLSTRILIAANQFLLHYWIWVGIGIILFFISASLLMRIYRVQYAVQKTLIYTPIVGHLISTVYMSLFARTLSVLLKSGTKIIEALDITAGVIPNVVFKQALLGATEQVKNGAPLGKYLGNYPKIFPLMLSQMIEVSETAGTLDSTLSYLGEYYESELDDATKTLVSLLEPLLMISMGGIVGFIVLSILIPIYSISQVVN